MFIFVIVDDVFPFISKVKIYFSCYRIGHINKNCKGKPRCTFCERDAHDSMSPCSRKNDILLCINCQGEHLATSHDCPVITKHKMILSLAASENIPLVEARRKILQDTTAPKDIVFDYNFPLLNTSKTNNDNNSSYYSYNQSSNILHNNRFAVFNSSNNPDEPSEDVSAVNPPFNGSYRINKPTFSQTASHPHNKTITRSQKSPQKNDNFNSHINLLYSLNGRSPNMSHNGVGYNGSSIIDSRNENTNSSSTSTQNHEMHYNTNSNNPVSNIDIASLNNAILLLSRNVEFICNLARTANSLSNDAPSAPLTLI